MTDSNDGLGMPSDIDNFSDSASNPDVTPTTTINDSIDIQDGGEPLNNNENGNSSAGNPTDDVLSNPNEIISDNIENDNDQSPENDPTIDPNSQQDDQLGDNQSDDPNLDNQPDNQEYIQPADQDPDNQPNGQEFDNQSDNQASDDQLNDQGLDNQTNDQEFANQPNDQEYDHQPGDQEYDNQPNDQEYSQHESENDQSVQFDDAMSRQEQINALKQQIQDLIEDLDFQGAQELQEQIDQLEKDTHSQVVDDYAQQFLDSCEDIASHHFAKRNRLIRRFTKKEIDVRTKMDNDFTKLKSDHITDLMKLEKRLFESYKNMMSKPISAYDEMIQRAKSTAKLGDFSKAQEYQEQAEKIQINEELKRETQFKETIYKPAMNALLDTQSQQISEFTLSARLSIDDIIKKRSNEIVNENEDFRRKLNRLYRRSCDEVSRCKRDAVNNTMKTTKKVDDNKSSVTQNVMYLDQKLKSILLNKLEDTFTEILAKYGIQQPESAQKPKLIVSTHKPGATLSLRMQSRLESRESERKDRDEKAQMASSRAASRTYSRQSDYRQPQSPKSASKSKNNTNKPPKSPQRTYR